MAFFAIGKEQRTGRYLFTVKDDSVGAEGAQAGVYLDQLVMFMTINAPDKYWIVWMAPDKEGKVGCHHVRGDKTDEEREMDVLAGLRKDLRDIKFPARKLFHANSLEEAKDTLVEKLKVTRESADQIIAYLGGC